MRKHVCVDSYMWVVTDGYGQKENKNALFCLFYCNAKISVVQSNRSYDLKNSEHALNAT
jgi:hypothetical protein